MERRRKWWNEAPMLALALLASGALGASSPPEAPRAPAISSPRWINSEPLGPDLWKGRVSVVEFWTFGCVNCLHTVPAMLELERRYRGKDVRLIGVHTPEFERERDPGQVARAVRRLGILFPVAIDDDHRVWRAFDNEYWPALYLIDKRGVIRATHIGELHQGSPAWDQMIRRIETLRLEPA